MIKFSRVFVCRNGGFAIDLAEVVCVSRYYDETRCMSCQADMPIDRMTVYTRGDITEGFVLCGEDMAELVEAWQGWMEARR